MRRRRRRRVEFCVSLLGFERGVVLGEGAKESGSMYRLLMDITNT